MSNVSKSGRGGITATEDFRKEQDIVGLYLAERTRAIAGAKIKAGALYKDYAAWATEAGETALTLKVFGEAITTKGYEKKTSNGVWYLGIGLAQHEGPEVEEAIL